MDIFIIVLCLISLIISAVIGFFYWMEKTIFMGFKHLFESAKVTEMEEWLQWWQAAGIRFWKDAQK